MLRDVQDAEVVRLLDQYLHVLQLPQSDLRVTTSRATFQHWLGRRVSASLGGAYIFLPKHGEHAILINLPRIDRTKRKALEIVVAEELIHMRDHLDGDHRRHAKHGYDRIASRVARLTGASLDEVRNCLIPLERRPFRYLYACPRCGASVRRRRKGTWSCGRCSPHFDARFVLQLVAELKVDQS
jgi:predicted SprT family Zn-dependent metalloprotease